jgi:hypothetical protein
VKNLIVVGDSFCSWPGIKDIEGGWPQTLADTLGLNLVCYGAGGQPWWDARNFLINLSPDIVENAEFIVFAHTYGGRIPTLNCDLGKVDKSKNPTSEIELASHYYYKYIDDPNFLDWAQEQWLREITREYGHKKLCHLHSFPWTIKYSNLLCGINVTPNLTSISLNEINSKKSTLFNDTRSNHFSDYNNTQLGLQLAEQLKNYSNKTVELDISKFEQLTDYWFDIGNWD